MRVLILAPSVDHDQALTRATQLGEAGKEVTIVDSWERLKMMCGRYFGQIEHVLVHEDMIDIDPSLTSLDTTSRRLRDCCGITSVQGFGSRSRTDRILPAKPTARRTSKRAPSALWT